MSGYIGTTPVPQATQHREAFTANAGQTTFATAGYTVGYIDVWVNGVKLAAADVTVTNGSDIVLASAAAANDIIEYLAFVPFEAVNQTFTGATVINSLNINSDGATVTGIKDEDNMASNDANKLATQQSIKAYVDATVAATNEVVEDTTPQLGGDLASNGNDILMADNDKVILGTGSDLQIYHDGSNARIRELTGELRLQTTSSGINALVAKSNAAVELFHAGSKKAETTATGIDVTGNATFADNGKAIFGAGSDLQIYHDGSHSRISDQGTGNLIINAGEFRVNTANDAEAIIKGNTSGDVALYYAGGLKLATTATGIDVTGNVTFSNNNTDDTNKEGHILARQYDSGTETEGFQVLQYFSNSSSNKIDVGGAASTYNAATGIDFYTAANTTTRTGTKRLGIDSTGIQVTGNIANASGDLTLDVDEDIILDANSGYIKIHDDGAYKALISTVTGHVVLQNMTANSDIIFNKSDGSAMLTLDASNDGSATFSHDIFLPNGAKIQFGPIIGSGNAILSVTDGNATLDATGDIILDADGNVGIGTSSPATTSGTYKNLQVALGATVIGRTDDTPLYLSSNLAYNSDWKYIANTTATQVRLDTNIKFFTAPTGTAGNTATLSEAMRIDSSGNVLVGTTNSNPTSSSVNVAGQSFSTTGGVRSTVASNPAATFNRKTNDGEIVLFRKDGSTVGNIGTTGGKLYIGTSDGSDAYLRFESNEISPCTSAGAFRDGAIDLGKSASRWKDLYLSGGVYLGGTGAANKLDDYEEGTWTPTLDASGGASGQGYAHRVGSYTKIGNKVTANWRIVLNAKGTLTGTTRISGLPFNGNASPIYNVASTMVGLIYLDDDENFKAMQYAANAFLYLMKEKDDTNLVQISGNGNFDNDSEISGSVTYFTNS